MVRWSQKMNHFYLCALSWVPEGLFHISRQSCGSFTGCRFGNVSSSNWQYLCLKSWMALRRRICQTTVNLSATPAADSYGLPASKHVRYNVPLQVLEIGLLLPYNSDWWNSLPAEVRQPDLFRRQFRQNVSLSVVSFRGVHPMGGTYRIASLKF